MLNRTCLRMRACAKINFYLGVLPPRGDGMHPLVSLFATVGVYDELAVGFLDGEESRASGGLRVNARPEGVVPEDGGTLRRAWELYRRCTGAPERAVEVELTKNIPSGAGLGGGSSDAAAFLHALCWLDAVDSAALEPHVHEIGADVPFFFSRASIAEVEGIGEDVRPLEVPAMGDGGAAEMLRPWVVLCSPPFPVSTPAAYRALDEAASWEADERTHRNRLRGLLDALGRGDESGFHAALHNDFEKVVRRIRPRIGRVFELMEGLPGVRRVLLCGSGSTVAAFFRNREEATGAASVLGGILRAEDGGLPGAGVRCAPLMVTDGARTPVAEEQRDGRVPHR